jgi:cyclase
MGVSMNGKKMILGWTDFPEDFPTFYLDPSGSTLSIKEIGKGVYALLSSISNVDNAGFVVGEKGVLVIDAHISIPMARQIQERVREVTDKPIRYLVNSNYHGDHTFGNCAFPAETLLIQQRETAIRVPYMEEEKAFLLPCVGSKPEIFEGVTLRLPDIVFDDYLRIDLGGQIVETHCFGPANTPGDTITYVPSAKAAWTGNMTGGGTFSLALESDAPTFMETLARFVRTLEVETLVPSHSSLSGPSVLWRDMTYYARVTSMVNSALSAGWALQETIERTPLWEEFSLPPTDPRAKNQIARHRYNVQKTFLSLSSRRSKPRR